MELCWGTRISIWYLLAGILYRRSSTSNSWVTSVELRLGSLHHLYICGSTVRVVFLFFINTLLFVNQNIQNIWSLAVHYQPVFVQWEWQDRLCLNSEVGAGFQLHQISIREYSFTNIFMHKIKLLDFLLLAAWTTPVAWNQLQYTMITIFTSRSIFASWFYFPHAETAKQGSRSKQQNVHKFSLSTVLPFLQTEQKTTIKRLSLIGDVQFPSGSEKHMDLEPQS